MSGKRGTTQPRLLPMPRAPGETEAEALPALEFNSTNALFPPLSIMKNSNVQASAKHRK